MAMLVTEECILCGACEPECPNEAIGEAEEVYEVDFNLCTERAGFYDEQQCVLVRPVDAIIFDPLAPGDQGRVASQVLGLHPIPTGLQAVVGDDVSLAYRGSIVSNHRRTCVEAFIRSG